MRLRLLLAASVVAALASAAHAETSVGTGALVTLHDAVSLALQHAFGPRIAAYREASANAKVGEALVAYVPDLTGTASKTYFERKANSSYPLPIPDSSLHGNQSQIDLDATYLLLSTTRRLDLKSAHLARDSANQQTEAARRVVIRDVARAYLQVVQSDALLRVADQDVSRRQRHHDEAEALVKAGKRAEYELIRANADLAAAQSTQVDSKNATRISRLTLAGTCGVSLPSDFATQPPTPPEDPRRGARGLSNETLDAVFKKRPDVRSADFDFEASRVSVSRAQHGYLPTLSLFARYTKLPQPTVLDAVDQQVTYGGQIEIRFSNMLTNAYRERDARAQARLSGVTADQTRAADTLDVERAMLEVDRAVEVLASVRKSLDAAKRNYETAAERYRLGVGTQTEQIDAEAALVSAEVDEAKADVAYRTAIWNLRYEMGEPLDVP